MMFIPTPWVFDCSEFSDVSDLDIYLRDSLRSWGSFFFSIAPTFRKGFRSHSRARWIDLLSSDCSTILLGVYDLFDGFLFYSTLVWRVSLGSFLSQKFPCFLWDPKFLDVLLRVYKQCPGMSYPWFLVSSLIEKEGILEHLPCYSLGLLWWSSFLLIM